MRARNRVPLDQLILPCSECLYLMSPTLVQYAAYRETRLLFCSPKCQHEYNRTHDDGLRLL